MEQIPPDGKQPENAFAGRASNPEVQLTQGLRQDLGLILGYAEMIQEALSPEVLESLNEQFEVIISSVQRANERLNQFDTNRRQQTNPNQPAS